MIFAFLISNGNSHKVFQVPIPYILQGSHLIITVFADALAHVMLVLAHQQPKSDYDVSHVFFTSYIYIQMFATTSLNIARYVEKSRGTSSVNAGISGPNMKSITAN